MRFALVLGGLVLGGVLVSACAFPYYMQAIGGQVGLLRQRVPIEEVIADPAYDAGTRDHAAATFSRLASIKYTPADAHGSPVEIINDARSLLLSFNPPPSAS